VANFAEGSEESRRHHPGRDGRPSRPGLLVEVGEVVIAKEPMTVVGQEPVDGTLLQPVAEDLPRVLEALLDT